MKRFSTSTVRSVYWIGTLAWFVLVLVVLLKPSSRPSTHDHSLNTFLYTFFNFDFQLYNYFEAVGHVFFFIVLTALWIVTLSQYGTQSQALRVSIVIALVVAFGTEIGQFFVNRGALLFDLLANFLGITLTSVWIIVRNKPRVIGHD